MLRKSISTAILTLLAALAVPAMAQSNRVPVSIRRCPALS